jgi:Na+-transporting methylmalonyl-CoA/oxaloacetate decarboxylase beta subunit
MAALLGTNTAVLLFQGIEQESNPKLVREIALTIIAATIPFQGIYFLIYTFLLEHNGNLTEDMLNRLNLASALCQVFAYLSIGGVIVLWYSMSQMVGIAFTISAFIAMILVRTSMMQREQPEDH